MVQLKPFTQQEFGGFMSWINSEELLIQIAGHYFSYPLTEPQLQKYLEDEKSRSFKVLSDHDVVGHVELIDAGNKIYKIDKLILDPLLRRKGLGLAVLEKATVYCFENLGATEVELYVFEQNIPAIKTYEKAGFESAPDRMPFEVKGKTWIAFKMAISREKWQILKQKIAS